MGRGVDPGLFVCNSARRDVPTLETDKMINESFSARLGAVLEKAGPRDREEYNRVFSGECYQHNITMTSKLPESTPPEYWVQAPTAYPGLNAWAEPTFLIDGDYKP